MRNDRERVNPQNPEQACRPTPHPNGTAVPPVERANCSTRSRHPRTRPFILSSWFSFERAQPSPVEIDNGGSLPA